MDKRPVDVTFRFWYDAETGQILSMNYYGASALSQRCWERLLEALNPNKVPSTFVFEEKKNG